MRVLTFFMIAGILAGLPLSLGSGQGIAQTETQNEDSMMVMAAPDQAVVTEWVRRYNGAGNGHDTPRAIAVDAEGNVYVTGSSYVGGSYDDYATIKYSPAGKRLWLRTYDNLGGEDVPRGMAVDGQGNVYVTGKSMGPLDPDFATIKYAPDGTELWVRRYDGPGDYSQDEATAIGLDSQGNIYVTGNSALAPDYIYDIVTIKYAPNGRRLWVRRYNGPADGHDKAAALAVDKDGNVIVTGSSGGATTGLDYLTIKYDPDGVRLWVRRYNGIPGASGDDEATAIAVDGQGNVYVTGSSRGAGTWDDYATIKYSPDGDRLWVRRYNGPENNFDYAKAIAVDAQGNVFVTGESWGEFSSDILTIKYFTDGARDWVSRYNGRGRSADGGLSLALDTEGNAYVTGYACFEGTGQQSYDIATIKYPADGTRAWVKRYQGPGGDYDIGLAITVDANNNVYVAGASVAAGGDEDFITIKYSQTPEASQ
jgi:uncharacterized delta-60 repeat protein